MDYYNYGIQAYPNGYIPQYPYQPAPAQFTQTQPGSDNRFIWVQGKESAKAYPTAPDKTVLFLDDSEPYVYQKKTDREGKTIEFKVYKLVEEPQEAITNEIPVAKESAFVTKEDFNSAIGDLKAMISSMNKPSYNNYKGKKVNHNA